MFSAKFGISATRLLAQGDARCAHAVSCGATALDLATLIIEHHIGFQARDVLDGDRALVIDHAVNGGKRLQPLGDSFSLFMGAHAAEFGEFFLNSLVHVQEVFNLKCRVLLVHHGECEHCREAFDLTLVLIGHGRHAETLGALARETESVLHREHIVSLDFVAMVKVAVVIHRAHVLNGMVIGVKLNNLNTRRDEVVVGRNAHGNPKFAGRVGVQHVIIYHRRSQEGEILVLGDDDACRASVVALIDGGHLNRVVALDKFQVIN